MDFILIYLIFNGVRYWPVLALAAGMLMALIDLAAVGWVGLCVAVRAWTELVPIKNDASRVESE